MPPPKTSARWAAVLALAALASLACDLAGLPSPELFGGLVAGFVASLALDWSLAPPRPAVAGAQVIFGVALGGLVEASTVRAVGEHVVPVVLITVATLGLTVLAGLLVARTTDLDAVTASFGMIAGGASGIVAIADELGADNRIVAVLQYLRVLVIVLLAPIVAGVLFPGAGAGGGGAREAAALGLGDAALLLGISAGGGLLLARVTHLPAGTLLGPLLVAGGLTLAGVPFAGPVPSWLQSVAFVVIGLQVGLRFTPASLRAAGRALVPALAAIMAMLVGCALLGLALSRLTGISALDGYLATTPGGLYAVLATAVDSDADTTFVLAVQILRVFVMLLAAPVLARWLLRGRAPVAH